MRFRKASLRIPELGSRRVHADINNVYIPNPKNLRSSLAQTWLSSTCGLYEAVAPGRAASKVEFPSI